MGRLKLHRRGFRPKDAPAPSIARNLDKPKGREVTPADVAPHALPLHPPCRGKGLLGLRGDGRREICKCATKRFLRAHPEVILEADGRAWWPAPKADPSDGGSP